MPKPPEQFSDICAIIFPANNLAKQEIIVPLRKKGLPRLFSIVTDEIA
jgi:hypothetical protein